jgi:PhnB protein
MPQAKKTKAPKAKQTKPTKKAKKVSFIPKGYHTASAYLVVRNGAQALDFYQKAFGAKLVGKPMVMPDGKVGHAEFQIGDSRLMLADESPAFGNKSPETLQGSPVGFCLYVKNADAAFQKAVEAGAKVLQPLADQFYGDRSGRVLDPYGHNWTIATHIEDVSRKEMDKRMAAMAAQQPPAQQAAEPAPAPVQQSA